ncbi:hypothetical protein LTS17_007383 [Exophiala oligosperma]
MHSSPSITSPVGFPAATSSIPAGPPSYVLMPRTGQYMYMGLSLPSLIALATFEVLPPFEASNEATVKVDDDLQLQDNWKLDRSALTPRVMRFLLSQYDRCIRPQYDVPIPEVSNQDSTSLKKLPENQKFKILIACAIAAARESYKHPHWKAMAQLCRDWASESLNSVISSCDADSLTAILLLLVFELAEPSRGAVWELLDLAIRTCLQLGWHRTNGTLESVSTIHDTFDNSDKPRLMAVLKAVEGSLRLTFDRPNMLREARFSYPTDNDNIMQIFTNLSQEIYGNGQLLEAQACPFVGQSATLMDLLDSMITTDVVINETWLLFLPVCVRHKQCVFCFQEADDPNSRGMLALRHKVMASACKLLLDVHQKTAAEYNFIPPIVASSRAFTSGCVLATSIVKKWTSAEHHVRDLLRCSEVLTFFAPHWKGGYSYLEMWRTITNLLQPDPT